MSAGTLALTMLGPAQTPNKLFQLVSINVGRTLITIDWYTMPGSDLGAAAFDRIDANHDGKLSEAEGQAYAKRTLRNVTLIVDGRSRPLLIRGVVIAERKQMLTGLGSIDFLVYAEIPEKLGRHALSFENRYRRAESNFKTGLLNDPADTSIRVATPRQTAGGARIDLIYTLDKAPKLFVPYAAGGTDQTDRAVRAE